MLSVHTSSQSDMLDFVTEWSRHPSDSFFQCKGPTHRKLVAYDETTHENNAGVSKGLHYWLNLSENPDTAKEDTPF